MLRHVSRPVQAVPRVLKIALPPFLPRFKSSTASTASKSLAPPFKPPHPIFQSYSPPTRIFSKPSDQHRFRSTILDSLTDDEFNRLPPLEQIRLALTKAPQTTAPLLDSSMMQVALRLHTAGEVIGEEIEGAALSLQRMSLNRLAFLGDAIWSQAVIETLVVIGLDSMWARKPSKTGQVGVYKCLLTTNLLAADLARSTGLLDIYDRSNADFDTVASIWEAYLAALFLERGRRSLLEFLTPIVKVEFEKRLDVQAQVKTERTSNKASENAVEEVARLATVAKEVAKKEDDLRKIRLQPRSDPIIFTSLDSAKNDFRSTLDARKIPYLLTVYPSNTRATLQLPGTPLLAVKLRPKSANRKERAESKTKTQQPPSKPTANLATSLSSPASPSLTSPLVFKNADRAVETFFKQLVTRKIKFKHSATPEGQRTFVLSGYPPITSQCATPSEHRRALVERAIKLGIVRLKSSASSTKPSA
ncbi:hypothetical protein JCM5353_007322 [Sporobolomyces roseus]